MTLNARCTSCAKYNNGHCAENRLACIANSLYSPAYPGATLDCLSCFYMAQTGVCRAAHVCTNRDQYAPRMSVDPLSMSVDTVLPEPFQKYYQFVIDEMQTYVELEKIGNLVTTHIYRILDTEKCTDCLRRPNGACARLCHCDNKEYLKSETEFINDFLRHDSMPEHFLHDDPLDTMSALDELQKYTLADCTLNEAGPLGKDPDVALDNWFNTLYDKED